MESAFGIEHGEVSKAGTKIMTPYVGTGALKRGLRSAGRSAGKLALVGGGAGAGGYAGTKAALKNKKKKS